MTPVMSITKCRENDFKSENAIVKPLYEYPSLVVYDLYWFMSNQSSRMTIFLTKIDSEGFQATNKDDIRKAHMKKVFAIVAVALIPLLIQAGEDFYVGVQGGVNFLDCHYLTKRHCVFDTGYNVGAVGGYAWCNGLRLETEITYHDNDYRLHGRNEDGDKDTFHGNVNTWSFMTNGYFDIPVCICDSITPYIGVGIGVDRVHQKIKIAGHNYKGSNTGFAWQLMGGASYCLFEDTVLSVEYKFHMAPLRSGHELQNHSVILGVKRFFCCCF